MESLSKKLTAIVHDSKMCPDPAYYSGRGQTLTDLNSDILASIHKGINAEFGDKAASNFIKMVFDLRDLSATNFLNGLKLLEDSKFYWNTVYNRDQKSFLKPPKKGRDIATESEAGAFATVMSAATKRRQDTYDDIAGEFLANHPTRSIMRSNDLALNKGRSKTYEI